ncbi:hypothetical protein BC834DRAFT_892392, partial [Gloeopeniophorella convolvens]
MRPRCRRRSCRSRRRRRRRIARTTRPRRRCCLRLAARLPARLRTRRGRAKGTPRTVIVIVKATGAPHTRTARSSLAPRASATRSGEPRRRHCKSPEFSRPPYHLVLPPHTRTYTHTYTHHVYVAAHRTRPACQSTESPDPSMDTDSPEQAAASLVFRVTIIATVYCTARPMPPLGSSLCSYAACLPFSFLGSSRPLFVPFLKAPVLCKSWSPAVRVMSHPTHRQSSLVTH